VEAGCVGVGAACEGLVARGRAAKPAMPISAQTPNNPIVVRMSRVM
jgi:hypothetical protein